MKLKLWHSCIVATLALGLRTRQKVTRLWAKREAQESCRMLSGVQESVCLVICDLYLLPF